ncbi:hypothetical protein D0Y65_045812 [Glycine soja]|nr:hypothetical protein D0Y65_045812 [Glycine soja]
MMIHLFRYRRREQKLLLGYTLTDKSASGNIFILCLVEMPVSRSCKCCLLIRVFNFNFGSLSLSNRNVVAMQIRSLVEVEPPSPLRYLIGAAVMMIGVVLPVGYMMFRNKRVPSSSSYSKQTNKVLI